MLTVITALNDDVVDEATDGLRQVLTDFLQWTLISAAIVFVLTFVVAIAIAKKAGYSGWWGAIAVLVPPLGIILLLLFALLKWPALKERDEAIEVVEANELTIPSRERAAIKEAQRRKAVEEEARRRMEKAQAEREAADAERARYQARQEKAAAAAAAAPAVEASAEASAPPANDSVAPESEPKADAKPESTPEPKADAKGADDTEPASDATPAEKPAAKPRASRAKKDT